MECEILIHPDYNAFYTDITSTLCDPNRQFPYPIKRIY